MLLLKSFCQSLWRVERVVWFTVAVDVLCVISRSVVSITWLPSLKLLCRSFASFYWGLFLDERFKDGEAKFLQEHVVDDLKGNYFCFTDDWLGWVRDLMQKYLILYWSRRGSWFPIWLFNIAQNIQVFPSPGRKLSDLVQRIQHKLAHHHTLCIFNPNTGHSPFPMNVNRHLHNQLHKPSILQCRCPQP